MKKLFQYLIILLPILNYQFSIAQKQGQAKIDSLLQELPKAKEDSNKVKLLSILSFEYYAINPDEGIKYGEKGLQMCSKFKYKKLEANIFKSIGICYVCKSDYPKALDYFFKSLKINKDLDDKNGIASNFGNIGIIYEKQSDYPNALVYYFKVLKIYEELDDKNGIAISLLNIGNVYNFQSNYSKALDNYFKALKISEKLGDKSGLAINFGNIGTVYNDQSDYPKALEYYFKALKIHEELGEKNGIASILVNIGTVYNNQSNYPKALEYYFKALIINEEFDNKSVIAINLGNIGELYIKLSQDTIYDKLTERNVLVGLTKEINLRRGIDYSLKAVSISMEIGDLTVLVGCYNNLYEGYKIQGNYSKALEYHELFKKMQDSVFNIEKAKSIANLEAKRENELKEKRLQLQQAELEKKNWQLFGSTTAIFMMIIFSIFVIRERRKSEKLLLNILPAKIANRLKRKEHPIADHYEEASIVFIDIVEFTKASSGVDPKSVVNVLNILYTKLDTIAKKHGLEKIKTIGDCYMAASGIPISDPENAIKAAQFSIESMKLLKDYDTGDGTILNFRCGVDCGAVIAGVIGEMKFIYDIWGDTVNTASRMEEYGESGKIQVTEKFKDKLKNEKGKLKINFHERGEMEIRGKGMMKTYFLNY